MTDIFDISGKTVVVNINCLLIPELKKVYENYKDDYLSVFSYLHYMTSTSSPYSNLESNKKEAYILRDFPGTYEPGHKLIVEALEKITELQTLPEDRLFEAAKDATDRLSHILTDQSQSITDIKELKILMEILSKVGSVADNLEITRKKRDEARARGKSKGNKSIAYDQR